MTVYRGTSVHMKAPSCDLPMTTPIVVMSDKERVSPNAVVFFAHSVSLAGSKHFNAPIVLAAFLKKKPPQYNDSTNLKNTCKIICN